MAEGWRWPATRWQSLQSSCQCMAIILNTIRLTMMCQVDAWAVFGWDCITMDLNGCSAKGSQKVARENITQNTFFFSWGGGGRTGQKNNNCLKFVLNAKCVCTWELQCLPFLYTCFWSWSIFAQDMTTFMGFSCGEARGVEVPSSRGETDLDSCRLTRW